MKLKELAFQQGIEFYKSIFIKEDKENCINLYNNYFYFSRHYNNEWDNNFKLGFFKNLDKNNLKNIDFFYNTFFNFSIKIENFHIENIEKIINEKSIFSLGFIKNYQLNIIDFLLSYKSYIFSKHLYILIFYFNTINTQNHKNIYDFLKNIDRLSLTQKIFNFKNNSAYFIISKNKGPCFLIWNQKSIYAIDVSISNTYNKKIYNIHNLITQNIVDEIPKNIQKKLIEIHKNEDTFLKNNNQNNNQNIKYNYVLSFDMDIIPNNISIKNFKIIKLLFSENNFIGDVYIFQNTLNYFLKNNLLFNDFLNSFKLKNHYQKIFFESLFNKKIYQNIYQNFCFINPDDIDIFYTNIFKKIEYLINNTNHIDLSIFYEFGYQNTIEYNEILQKINSLKSSNPDYFDFIKNKKQQNIIFDFLLKI